MGSGNIEPIAARLIDDAAQIEAMQQRLQQCSRGECVR